MVGVMGLSSNGLGFKTPDNRPIHCMVLLATPSSDRDRHIEVLASLAHTIGSEHDLREALFDSQTPADAYEILHGDETEGFNRFLDLMDEVD